MRQIVLDTETTGLEVREGHRIIEIGCVELINRRLTQNRFHTYLNPDRHIDDGAIEVHGIKNEFLADKPRFAEIGADLLAFVRDTEIVIHNATFDLGFLDAEYMRIDAAWPGIRHYCKVVDTLPLARQMHPGQKNNLDALCKRYNVDNTQRSLHGALLDAEILAEVYLAMTGGQAKLSLEASAPQVERPQTNTPRLHRSARLRVIAPSPAELAAHQQRLRTIAKTSGGESVWQQLELEQPSAVKPSE
ncbi:MAG: DNA polymerase III subunit epsilon [Gammaproteobacteria bacterium]|nr:DNA polymerase III subunit epsilon [Gammaproteobacteria bacterium]